MNKDNYKNFKEQIRMQQHIIDKQDKKIIALQQEIDRLNTSYKECIRIIRNSSNKSLFARIFNK